MKSDFQYKVARTDGFYSLLAGAIAGGMEAFITQPITANRLRVQSVPPLAITLNPRVLYRGVYTNMVTMTQMIAIRFTVRNSILQYGFDTVTPNLTQLMTSAFLGGVSTSAISSMTELGMLHQQKVKAESRAPTVPAALFYIAKNRGVRRVFLGMPCVAVRDGCFAMGFMGLTPVVKELIREPLKLNNDTALTAVSGALSGLTAAIISHPCDTIKSAQQSDAFNTERDSVAAWKTAKRIVQQGGIKGLYRGLLFRGTRVTVGITFLSYATPTLSERMPDTVKQIRSSFNM